MNDKKISNPNTFPRGLRFLYNLPLVWLIVFFLIPFLIILKISISASSFSIPPYKPLVECYESVLSITVHVSSYLKIFTDLFYVKTLLSSMYLSFAATFTCLILGFMMAYGICRTQAPLRHFLLVLVVLPFWTSFLIRVYAWMSLLSHQGVVNLVLMECGLISSPVEFIGSPATTCLGIVYCYLPFMVLPIYSTLEKIDPSLIEASFDLGASRLTTFFKITIPLSKSGILAGCTLVFLPSIGEFVIPELLGGGQNFMIGRVLWSEFFQSHDWPFAASLAIVIVILFVVPLLLLQSFVEDKKK